MAQGYFASAPAEGIDQERLALYNRIGELANAFDELTLSQQKA